MIVVTSSEVAGTRVRETIGLVRGSAVRSRHAGKDLIAWLRNLVGGEIPEYTKMLAEAREQALDRMISDAKHMGANAVLDARLEATRIAGGTAEIIAYGTAVILEDDHS